MILKAFSRACLVLAASLCASAAFAQTREASSSGVLLDRVAATVNEGVVLSSELDEQMLVISERLRSQKLDLPPQNVLRQQVLDRLVLQELQMQRANRAGIKVSDETLNNALRDVAEQNKIPLADLPAALASQGIDYASYREGLRKELAMQILRQRDVIGRINVSPREIDQFLERQKKMPSESNEYNVSHILDRGAAGRHARAARRSRQEGRRGLPEGHRPAKTSAASRCPIPTRRPRSKADRSAGARARSCPPSSPKSSPA